MPTCYICKAKPVTMVGMPCRPCSIQRNKDINAGIPVCDDPFSEKECGICGTTMTWDSERQKRNDWIKKIVCSEPCRIIQINRPEASVYRKQKQKEYFRNKEKEEFKPEHVRSISRVRKDPVTGRRNRESMYVFHGIQSLLGGRTRSPEAIARSTETRRKNMEARVAAGLPKSAPISEQGRINIAAAHARRRGQPIPHQDRINESNRKRIEREKAAGIKRTHSEETKAKIGAKTRERYATGQQMRVSPMKGRTMSEEVRRKMSEAHKGKRRRVDLTDHI